MVPGDSRYLKTTAGQRVKLPFPTRGGRLASCQRRSACWTFTDADWGGRKTHRQSTTSLLHVVVFAMFRGQKTVSPSSAELEELVTEFSSDDVSSSDRRGVQRVCLLDNCQIMRKRGSGKLRHSGGKLLWRQEMVDGSETNWSPPIHAEGNRVGEQETQEVDKKEMNRAKGQRLAKCT